MRVIDLEALRELLDGRPAIVRCRACDDVLVGGRPRSDRAHGYPARRRAAVRVPSGLPATIRGVSGLFLNAYALAFDGSVDMWRLPRSDSDSKRDLEHELGVALWGERDAFWAARRPPGKAARVGMSVMDPRGRVLFAVREALIAAADSAGREAWFGRGGEMSVLGLVASQHADRFELQPQLTLRFVQEGYLDAPAAILVRAKTRWRCSGSLAQADLHGIALGERAVRLNGSGPRAGLVDAIGPSGLRLRTGPATVDVACEDYALVAGSRLVAAWRGSGVLRDLQVASGVLTESGRRNRYAVHERFRMAGQMVRTLTWPVELPGGATVSLGDPIRVRRASPT